MQKQSVARILGISALAVVLGLLSPFSLWLMPLVIAVPVICVWLYTWGGPVPACVYSVCVMGIGLMMGGVPAMWLLFLMLIVPAAVSLVAIRSRNSYVTCIGTSIAAQMVCLLVGLLITRSIVGTDLAGALAEYLAAQMKQLPAEMVDPLLIALGRSDLFSSAALNVDFTKEALTAAEHIAAIDSYSTLITDGMQLALPSIIVTAGLTTGILLTALPVYIWARRGSDLGSRRIRLAQWRIPRSAAIGMPMCLLLAYILARSGQPAGAPLFETVKALYILLLQIQGLGAISRKMEAAHVTRGKRAALLILFFLFTSALLCLIGVFSLYLGERGLITVYLKKKVNKNNDSDNDR